MNARYNDICKEFGRGIFNGKFDLVDDLAHGPLHGFSDIGVRHDDFFGKSGNQIPAAQWYGLAFFHGKSGSDRYLDSLCRALSYQDPILILRKTDNVFIEPIPRYPQGLCRHNTPKGDDCDFGCASSHIYHEVPSCLLDFQTGSDGSSHGLFDEIYFPGSGRQGGVSHRFLFHLGDAKRNAHDDPGPGRKKKLLFSRFVNKIPEHLLGHLKIRDDSFYQRTGRNDVTWRATHHFLRLFSNGKNLAGFLVYRDHRRLLDNDAPAAHIDKRIRRSQVNGNVLSEI